MYLSEDLGRVCINLSVTLSLSLPIFLLAPHKIPMYSGISILRTCSVNLHRNPMHSRPWPQPEGTPPNSAGPSAGHELCRVSGGERICLQRTTGRFAAQDLRLYGENGKQNGNCRVGVI